MPKLTNALGYVAKRVWVLLQNDTDLRTRLSELAHALLKRAEQSLAFLCPTSPKEAPTKQVPDARIAEAPVAPAAGNETAVAPPSEVSESTAIHIATTRPTPQRTSIWTDVTDSDLPMIEARCRLKAEGARWAWKRQQLVDEGADFQMEIAPLNREIIEKAKKLPDCYLWMNNLRGHYMSDQMLVDDLAGSFETMADAVALVRGLLNDPSHPQDDLERALQLLAESQSALYVATNNVGYKQDNDKRRVSQWLRTTISNRQVYIARFMKRDDPADPRNWQALKSRIEASSKALVESSRVAKAREAAFNKIRYHLDLVHGSEEADHDHDWKVAITTIDELVQSSIPPSNTEIREILLPVIDRLPDVVIPPGMQLVLREVDRFLSTRPAPNQTAPAMKPTNEVRQVAELLRGRTLVLIGGDRRVEAEQALVSALELEGLKWIETREHESVASFESHIARPEVAAVLLAIRWSSHSYGDVKQFCDRYDKPLVRLPAGYNPNQVATQVLRQISNQLRERKSELATQC